MNWCARSCGKACYGRRAIRSAPSCFSRRTFCLHSNTRRATHSSLYDLPTGNILNPIAEYAKEGMKCHEVHQSPLLSKRWNTDLKTRELKYTFTYCLQASDFSPGGVSGGEKSIHPFNWASCLHMKPEVRLTHCEGPSCRMICRCKSACGKGMHQHNPLSDHSPLPMPPSGCITSVFHQLGSETKSKPNWRNNILSVHL